MASCGREATDPHGAILVAARFKNAPVDWNRIGAFQDVTMRLLAERLLPAGLGPTFVQGELANQRPALPPPRRGEVHGYHLYVSQSNLGALEFLAEYAATQRMRRGG